MLVIASVTAGLVVLAMMVRVAQLIEVLAAQRTRVRVVPATQALAGLSMTVLVVHHIQDQEGRCIAVLEAPPMMVRVAPLTQAQEVPVIADLAALATPGQAAAGSVARAFVGRI
jgi:hypothetical protein